MASQSSFGPYAPDRWTFGVKLYALGKAYFRADGPADWADAVEEAIKRSARLSVYLDLKRFHLVCAEGGVPLEVREEFPRTMDIEDGAFFGEERY